MEKKVVFGLTLKEIQEMMDEVYSWTDSNSPICTSEESFDDVLIKGSTLLQQNDQTDFFSRD